ncbi:hypothetical protein Y032_0053g2301 [Ancylostoma ceylanicum]|uniref:Uncharacterized protein n=1 Tax=Ancylostoma ceylanicum TaxID=53326 RepID=A0A016U791_9BILA|nr:hypothetical protein Y032_0053g2301 [Ancylostoma ceylanicum]
MSVFHFKTKTLKAASEVSFFYGSSQVMWWHATDWANLFKLVLQYALVLYVLAIQTITFCTSEKKEPSSKDVSKEDAQVMTSRVKRTHPLVED